MHCRLRLHMSDLKDDMFHRHLVDDPLCACGAGAETAGHYLLFCHLFNEARTNTISQLPTEYCNTEILLKGNHALSVSSNKDIFQAVHNFIRESKRF